MEWLILQKLTYWVLLTYWGQVICVKPKFRYEAYGSVAWRYGLAWVMKKSSGKCFPHLQQDIKVEGLWAFLAFFLSAASCSYLKEKWTDLWVYPFLLNFYYKKLFIFKNREDAWGSGTVLGLIWSVYCFFGLFSGKRAFPGCAESPCSWWQHHLSKECRAWLQFRRGL